MDLLRLVAALCVMINHFSGKGMAPAHLGQTVALPSVPIWMKFGSLGVELFFVISGFVILMSAWGRRTGDFVMSRLVRLYPAYWVSILVALAMLCTGYYLLPGPTGHHSQRYLAVQELLPNLTMFQTGVHTGNFIGVYWTLWVEIHFYVLIGVALTLWRGRLTYQRTIAFMLSWLLVSVFALEADNRVLIELSAAQYSMFFISGMAFFLIYRYGPDLVLWAFAGVGYALGVYEAIQTDKSQPYIPTYWPVAIPVVITAIYVVMAVVAVHGLDWVRWRGLRTLGALTYPLYLLHPVIAVPIVGFLYHRVSEPVLLALATGAPILAAYLTYRLVEQPAQRVLKVHLTRALARMRASEGVGEVFERS